MYMWQKGSLFALGILHTTAYPITSPVSRCSATTSVQQLGTVFKSVPHPSVVTITGTSSNDIEDDGSCNNGYKSDMTSFLAREDDSSRASCVVTQEVPKTAPAAPNGPNSTIVAAGIASAGAVVCAIITGIVGPLVVHAATKPTAAADGTNNDSTDPVLPAPNDPLQGHAAVKSSTTEGSSTSTYPMTHLHRTRLTLQCTRTAMVQHTPEFNGLSDVNRIDSGSTVPSSRVSVSAPT